ncbi:MAG: tRNA threonylcarbamoyladenosine dehydratase [Endomicrobia bacterium]|nr:tRNA threonylcarbamoyladenosine dehydratase [Endomicrobiia bacterium]MCL2799895.1 tRNA threonylcarbamoyladenosine dehydratase [Endomicrobiia bacterium]
MEQFLRTELLFGEEKLQKLQKSKIAVIGLGAVGSFAAEALARSGIGEFLLIDSDTVQITNLNRQLFALHSTLGKLKTKAAKERILDINPECKIETMHIFVNADNIEKIFKTKPDMVIDAIDSFDSKAALLEHCVKNSIPVVSSMGAALKTDPSKIQTADLFKTHYCKLAQRIREELKKRGIKNGIPCVFSEQPPQTKPLFPENLPEGTEKFERNSAKILGSYNVITGIFGLLLADLAIKKLTGAA